MSQVLKKLPLLLLLGISCLLLLRSLLRRRLLLSSDEREGRESEALLQQQPFTIPSSCRDVQLTQSNTFLSLFPPRKTFGLDQGRANGGKDYIESTFGNPVLVVLLLIVISRRRRRQVLSSSSGGGTAIPPVLHTASIPLSGCRFFPSLHTDIPLPVLIVIRQVHLINSQGVRE